MIFWRKKFVIRKIHEKLLYSVPGNVPERTLHPISICHSVTIHIWIVRNQTLQGVKHSCSRVVGLFVCDLVVFATYNEVLCSQSRCCTLSLRSACSKIGTNALQRRLWTQIWRKSAKFPTFKTNISLSFGAWWLLLCRNVAPLSTMFWKKFSRRAQSIVEISIFCAEIHVRHICTAFSLCKLDST